MAERYFPGFAFKKSEPVKEAKIITIPYNGTANFSRPMEVIRLEDLFGDSESVVDEPEPQLWTPSQLQKEFVAQLGKMDRQIRSPRLTMSRRTLTFVTPDEMIPKTDKEKQSLIQRYGNYVADGGIGDCMRNPDGTFTIRIGFAGQEDTVSKEDVLELMGHEYGHTLGEHLEDPIFEELKANAFANLFMRSYFNVSRYRIYQIDVSTIHDTAQFWLEQLLDKGINEEAILAHLTGNRFRKSYPNDYLDKIRP